MGLGQFRLRTTLSRASCLLVLDRLQFGFDLLLCGPELRGLILSLDHPLFKIHRPGVRRGDRLILRLHPALLRRQRGLQILDASLRGCQLRRHLLHRGQLRLKTCDFTRSVGLTAVRHLPVRGETLFGVLQFRIGLDQLPVHLIHTGGGLDLLCLYRRIRLGANFRQSGGSFSLRSFRPPASDQPDD